MITFRQKNFTEYDAMRSLYVEIMKRTNGDNRKFPIIDTSALIPILRGNNIVIERFVITTSFFGKDRYRMYLKIGARAKMPDEVRLPGRYYDERIGNLQLNVNSGLFVGGNGNNNKKKENKPKQKNHSDVRQKLFGNGAPPNVSASFSPAINITHEVHRLLGDAVKYDKKSRSLVLEFDTINDAINAINILPFGIDYKIYLLGV